ncbi:1,5-anhydro-D-fructose reductase [Anatilimnocola aggregata]|uniref:1,5-anhydro-D-fructose reductase n=1 Tax=Anatilimnocola aggregata TaxID=2528021 RepID=A0A517Y7D9_9BACT|nr:Gfo/Idh/MocA family oxidoreductase [Anatilimnocola aggregata]QDU26062.1 1,5-anhydro-D-fructose reductase [Anatilimnocola aggregata]
MTDQDRVRISFIGAGGICEQRHLPNLQQIPGIELVAVCNRSRESGQRAQQKWGFARVETEWQKGIDDPAVDAIFVGTWPYLHRELSIAALNAGKHVFCQARLSMDWAEARQMVAAAQAQPQLVNMVCPSPFRVRWERTIKQLLASGRLGELQTVSVESTSFANGNPNQVSWREERELSGLNIMQVGIFAETIQAWCGEYQSLAATTAIPLREKTTAAGEKQLIQIPQIVSLSGMLSSGAICREYHSGLAIGSERSEITLFGSRGTCVANLREGRITLASGTSPHDQTLLDETGDPWRVEQEFIDAVRAARRGEAWQVSPDFAAGSRYMLKMQALHDSATQLRTVKLSEY